MTKILAILAGQGDLPQLIANAALKRYARIVMIGFKGITPLETLQGFDANYTVGLAQVGKLYKLLKTENVMDVCLIGKLKRPSLSQLIPDLRGAKLIAKLKSAKGDDALLRTIGADIEAEGFTLVGAAQIAPQIVASEGPIHGKMDKAFHDDITYGLKIARAVGQLDIGQAVVVQQGLILGVEGIDGTDALIKRCAALKRKGRAPILVKCAKPQQDLRLDMPVIGDHTVQACKDAGFTGIAVEAGRVIVTITAASQGLWVWGCRQDLENVVA